MPAPKGNTYAQKGAQTKSCVLHLRCTPADWNTINEAASIAGLSMTEYCVQATLATALRHVRRVTRKEK